MSVTKTPVVVLAEHIAAALGTGYHAEGPDRDGEYWSHGHGIFGPEDQRLFLSIRTYGHDKGKLTISAAFPPNSFGVTPQSRPQIGVGPAASPERVAAEIRRRLLVEYLPTLRDYKQQIADAAAAEEARDRLGYELVHLAGNAEIRAPRNGQFCFLVDGGSEPRSVEVRVFNGGDRVDVRMEQLTADDARRLLVWVRAELINSAGHAPARAEPCEADRQPSSVWHDDGRVGRT